MLQYPHSHLVVPLRPLHKPPPPPTPAPAPPPPSQPRYAPPQRLPTPPLSPLPVTPSTKSERSSHSVHDVLAQGDIVGAGVALNGEPITEVALPVAPDCPAKAPPDELPAQHFEVVRKLGSGSYAVVYLVREYFGPLPPSSPAADDLLPAGEMDLDDSPGQSKPRYGREFAIKCLSKANQDSTQAQLLEATVHQSLPVHPNIVTLYRTLETPSLLLLVLESVPGEDLFYFLEQARDQHLEQDPHAPSHDLSVTPPTPSLLSSFQPAKLLSYGRLRLIASMFAQMCDAVAACHAAGVAHRDIKPENFIVTDGWVDGPDGRKERRVVVKLTDFGLATTDIESADMECGSAPYMSYECRNNLAPTYFPRPADVWSLGIVLINMLYHRNPWSDTSAGACSAFEFFLEHPVEFFKRGFDGMTQGVAEFLAESVFCILDSPDDTRRISPREFGLWVKDLPQLMGARPPQPAASIDTSSTTDLPQQRRQRKRGARNKGKGATAARDAPSPNDRLDVLATASQDLARELSRLSTRSSTNSMASSLKPPPPPVPPLPSPQRKQSRWPFSLKKQSSTPPPPALAEPVELEDHEPPRQMSATVSNVSNLIMGLSPPPPDPDRGRRRDREAASEFNPGLLSPRSPDWSQTRGGDSRRNVSPLSTRSRAAGASTLGPSFHSANWRNSMSSTSSVVTGSQYTRFSNSSMRSVSTANTSLSNSSWRTGPSTPSVHDKSGKPPLRRPSNVKDMSGIPWELHELPRQCHLDPQGYTFGPPPKKARAPGASSLSTISEGRNGNVAGTPPKLTVYTQAEAAVSASGLSPPQSPDATNPDGTPRKVNKGQITALAKMLSALKR